MTWVFIQLPGEFVLTAGGLGQQLKASLMGIHAFHKFVKTSSGNYFCIFLYDFLKMVTLKGVQTGSAQSFLSFIMENRRCFLSLTEGLILKQFSC